MRIKRGRFFLFLAFLDKIERLDDPNFARLSSIRSSRTFCDYSLINPFFVHCCRILLKAIVSRTWPAKWRALPVITRDLATIHF